VPWVSRVTLDPKIVYGGEKQPSQEEVAALHQQSHHYCFIANSVKTVIAVKGFEDTPAG
jgi:organic hydroperoxide reductase OsmC/OhrA